MKNTSKGPVLFIQLPLTDHGYNYILGNIEYAGASLSGYLRKNFPGIVASTLPFMLGNFASNQVIARYVTHCRPSIVCFSCYLWNIERSLHLADLIKSLLPESVIIFGGPEISRGSCCFMSPQKQVDLFISGEGEWFFRRFLRDDDLDTYTETINENRLISQPPDELVGIDEIVEPFTANMLNTMVDGSIFLELTRGCPYQCSYCYYSRNCPGVREIPFDLLKKTLTSPRHVSEIYILSPTLDRSADFHRRLEELASLNHQVSLHSEMRAGSIDIKTARLLYRAGFRSMEVGLQSLSVDVLKKVRRGSDPFRELKGMEAMRDAGIDLKIGIIPGLPGESSRTFTGTIDALVDRGFSENIELYPLMVLPGTSIREQALSESVQFQKNPPYFYLDGWGMSLEDITAISAYTESRTGFSPQVLSIPDFTSDSRGLLVKGVTIQGSRQEQWDGARYDSVIETSVFSFQIDLENAEYLYRGLPLLLPSLPRHILYNIMLYSDSILDEERIITILRGSEYDSFHSRNNLLNAWKDTLPWRMYQVMDNPEMYTKACSLYGLVEPVLSLCQENAMQIKKLLIDESFAADEHFILVRKGALKILHDLLIGIYGDAVEMISFEDMGEQAAFYTACRYEHVALPFTFRVVDLR